MASRLKEQEKNEKIVRSLTKLTDNRKCINCGSLGPQYVCTNFSIFICTTCSGIHREFTHRVKSISMATFTPAEVAALQAGGNQRAREIYFKEWDSTRQSLPDTSNPDKLRDFIKAVYVDKRFSGDRRRPSDAEEAYDSRKPDRFKYSQSPSYEERSDDRRYSNRPVSRGSDRGYDDKMSPARFDDRDRYDRGYPERDRDRRYEERDRRYDDRERRYEERDRYNEDRRFEDRRYEDRDRRYDERRYEYEDQRRWDDRDARGGNRRSSDDLDKRANRPSSYRGGETPPLRSVRDILGEDVPKLRVEDGTRTNGRVEDVDSPHSVSSQQSEGRLRSLKSLDAASNGSAKVVVSQPTPAISESLIDFSADPEPLKVENTKTFDPFATAEPKTNSGFDPFATSEPPKTNTSFDPFATSEQPSQVTSSSSGWASFDLSPPKVTPAATSTPTDSFFQQPVSDPSNQPKPNGVQAEWSAGLNGWPSQGAQPAQSFQQMWNAPVPSTSGPVQQQQQQQLQPHQHQLQQQQQHLQHLQQPQAPIENVQNQQNQRRAIPEDLFFAPQAPPFNMGMHMSMRPGFGFPPQQFHAPMPGVMPSYGQAAKSNPFDLPGDSTPSASFPSMGSLQNALPGFNPGPLSTPAPALGGPQPQWSQPGIGVPPASYPPSALPGGNFNQQHMPPHMMPHLAQSHFARPSAEFGNPPGPAFMNGSLPAFAGIPQQNAMQPAGGGGGGGNPFG